MEAATSKTPATLSHCANERSRYILEEAMKFPCASIWQVER